MGHPYGAVPTNAYMTRWTRFRNTNLNAGKTVVAFNGLNLSKSVNRPNSRLNRVRDYLYVFGPSTKERILRDVFGKILVRGGQGNYNPNGPQVNVTSGWSSQFWTIAVNQGFLRRVRTGRTVKYHLVMDRYK